MLDHYHTMVQLSREMLAAARQCDWQMLVELGGQRDAVEARLHGAPHQRLESEAEKQLVAAVLAANGQIKSLVDAHLARLQQAGTDDDGAAGE